MAFFFHVFVVGYEERRSVAASATSISSFADDPSLDSAWAPTGREVVSE